MPSFQTDKRVGRRGREPPVSRGRCAARRAGFSRMLAVLSLTWVIRDDVRPSRIASPQEDEQKGASDAPAVRQLERAAEGRRLEWGRLRRRLKLLVVVGHGGRDVDEPVGDLDLDVILALHLIVVLQRDMHLVAQHLEHVGGRLD